MHKSNFFSYLLMHAGFFLYSFYTVLGKLAGKYDFLSLKWCAFYFVILCLLLAYAVFWQQVLKRVNLSVATANKSATIVWGMFWSSLFFGEEITLKKIVGVCLIVLGILILSFSNSSNDLKIKIKDEK